MCQDKFQENRELLRHCQCWRPDQEYLGSTQRYDSNTLSSSLDTAAWAATISLTCDIRVPKSDAAQKKRKTQYTYSKEQTLSASIKTAIQIMTEKAEANH